MTMRDALPFVIFCANLLLAGFMTGLIWFVQVVHYPLFANVAPHDFVRYHHLHSRLTTLVVAGPMVAELTLALLLIGWRPAGLSPMLVLICAGLALLTWLATFALSVPLHNALAAGYHAERIRRLVQTNWIRTVAWSLRCGLLGWGLLQLLTHA